MNDESNVPRVLVVGHSRSGSGAERVLLRYVEAMQAHGWKVDGACPEGFLDQQLRQRGIEPTIIPDLQLPSGWRPLALARMAARWLRAARLIRAAGDRSSLVLVNGLLALPAVRLAGRSARSLWLVHDVVVRPDLRLVARLSSGPLALAVGVSRAAADYPAELGIPTEVVRNGTVWPTEAAPIDMPKRPIIGINAMVTPWKGHHVLLDAVAELPDVDLEIMGGQFPKDATYVEQLKQRAAEPDLAGRVRFLGHVDDPLAAMRSWSVAVSASVDPEAGPLAVLEAMSLGLPVVATNHGGAVEVVGQAGLLVEPGRPGPMAEALRRLTTDHRLRSRCAAAGRTAVADSLTEEASNRSFLKVAERLMTGGVTP